MRQITRLRATLEPVYFADGVNQLRVDLDYYEKNVASQSTQVMAMSPDMLVSEFDYLFDKMKHGMKAALEIGS